MIDSNAQLKTQVSVLTQKNDDLAALEQENKELAAALEIKSAKPTLFANSKVAYIGNRTLRDSEQSMLINLGSADGVKLNQIATTTDGQLIGYIDEVSTTSATLRLLQDIQSKVPIKVLETKNTEGIIEGQTGFTLALNYVPTTSDLKAEQIVVTSGLDGRFPANLVVGKVGKVTKTESNPFQSAEVIPGVDVRKITTVLILNL